MTATTLKIKLSKTDKNPVSVNYDFGNDLAEACAKFDGKAALDQVVFGLFTIAAKQQLADFVRRQITARRKAKKSASPAEIQTLVDGWKPEVQRRDKATVSKTLASIGLLSAAQREALFAEMGVSAEHADKLTKAAEAAAAQQASEPKETRAPRAKARTDSQSPAA